MKVAWLTIAFGIILAIFDSISLSIFKAKAIGLFSKYIGYMMLGFAFSVSFIQAYIFYRSMFYEKLAIMNLVWDLSSDIIVTLIGIIIFTEKLSLIKIGGVGLSMISILLLNIN